MKFRQVDFPVSHQAISGFANWGEYKAAVAASNPGIADLNQVAAGTTLMQP